MGINDREYARSVSNRARPRARNPAGWSVNTWLIAINVAIHVLASTVLVIPGSGGWSTLHVWGHFSTARAFVEFTPQGGSILRMEIWRFLSFQFLHSPGIMHLAFNMLGLYIFGSMVEEYLGRKKYLAFYLVCGIFGAIAYLFLNLLGVTGVRMPGVLVNDPHTPLVGASAGVFGVILACAFIAPNTVVQLIFPPIPLRMKLFAYGYVALAALNLIVFRGPNQGGDAAHLGGAIAGFFFIRNSHLLLDFFDVLGDSRRPKGARARPGAARPVSRGAQREVDRVLDKVAREGMASLTAGERRTLERASRRER